MFRGDLAKVAQRRVSAGHLKNLFVTDLLHVTPQSHLQALLLIPGIPDVLAVDAARWEKK